MKIWVISDTHFFHFKIMEYCHRNFKDEREMNQKMINKWNSVVSNNDLVIHLGDFALHKESDKVKETCKLLKGRKILVRGNHERKSLSWYCNNGFEFVCDSFTIGQILFTHRPIPKKDFLLMPYQLNIHGHIHDKDIQNAEIYENASVENTNYYPVNLDTILGNHKLSLKRKNKQGD